MEKKDYLSECGVQKEDCDGGQRCFKDNGLTKYCIDCLCAKCIRGKCAPGKLIKQASWHHGMQASVGVVPLDSFKTPRRIGIQAWSQDVKKMRNEGKQKLDDFLLNCADISQEEREVIMEFINTLKKELEND